MGEGLGLTEGLALGLTLGLAEGLALGDALGDGAALEALLEEPDPPQAHRDKIRHTAAIIESSRFMENIPFRKWMISLS